MKEDESDEWEYWCLFDHYEFKGEIEEGVIEQRNNSSD